MANFLTIRHEVKDFAAWKKGFDADAPNRAAAGLADMIVVRETDNPNLVGMVFGVSDPAKAKATAASPQLKEAMEKAGVIGAPVIRFLQGELNVPNAETYLTLTCKVSGIDTFRKGYAMDAADRQKASLTDLGVLQSTDDPNALFLLWAVGDIARATAFLNSPDLAEHQTKNAGIVSKPEAHFWTK